LRQHRSLPPFNEPELSALKDRLTPPVTQMRFVKKLCQPGNLPNRPRHARPHRGWRTSPSSAGTTAWHHQHFGCGWDLLPE
jgi:hypothetical protein